jgi:hypothetical protein
MNRDMTPRAFATVLKPEPAMGCLGQVVESGMALQAKLTAFSPNQQHAIRRAVRAVTRNATLDLCSRMLVHVRSTLFDVALDTGFRLCLHQT